jgi:hypothetical protein
VSPAAEERGITPVPGQTWREVLAQQLGHAPTMTLNVYGHVIAELQAAKRVSAEEAIATARSSRLAAGTNEG